MSIDLKKQAVRHLQLAKDALADAEYYLGLMDDEDAYSDQAFEISQRTWLLGDDVDDLLKSVEAIAPPVVEASHVES